MPPIAKDTSSILSPVNNSIVVSEEADHVLVIIVPVE